METNSNSNPDHTSPQVRVISLGFGHAPAPTTDEAGPLLLVVDLRERFRDPHVTPAMRYLTGLDPRVYDNVKFTPGVTNMIRKLRPAIADLIALGWGTITVVFGCVGGRHRSVVAARLLDELAEEVGWTCEVVHRDVDKPVLTSRRSRESAASTVPHK